MYTKINLAITFSLAAFDLACGSRVVDEFAQIGKKWTAADATAIK